MPAPEPNSFPHLDELLAQCARTTILTPNRRLSRVLHQHHAQAQTAAGQRAWASLRCYSWQGWIQIQWRMAQTHFRADKPVPARVELSPLQERWLWYDIIRQDAESLLVPSRTAKLAQDAWELVCQWQLDLDQLPDDNEEIILFKRWAKLFTAHCQQQQLIDQHSLTAFLLQEFSQQQLRAPETITLFGFDQFTPLQQALIDALRECGTNIKHCQLATPGNARQVVADNAKTEIEYAARWALQLIREHETPPKIAIVFPDLAKHRRQIEYVFNQIFQPQIKLPNQPRHATPYNMSASIRLNETALFRAATACLELNYHYLNKENVCLLLRSPFWADETELAKRSILATRIVTRHTQLTLSTLTTEAGTLIKTPAGDEKHLCPLLLQRLQSWRQFTNPPARQRPSQWAKQFAHQLSIMGWPGARTLDTIEFQQSQLIPGLFEQLASLDCVCSTIELTDALNLFQQLGETPFQAKTKSSPVQILGILEAAGQQFDYCWVAQMDDRHWPDVPSPNPLLPIYLQRQLAMPKADAERELQFAQRLTRQLNNSARQVIFSYARIEDDQILKPSPLLRPFKHFDSQALWQTHQEDYFAQIFAMKRTESFLDNAGPPLLAKENIRGGTRLLKDQSACPFKAFATHRLQAKQNPPLNEGFNSMERGNLIHQCLEDLWQRLQDQQQLLQQSPAQLETLIETTVLTTWNHLKLPFRANAIKQLELERTQKLLAQFLELERQRPPFRVRVQEGEQNIILGELRLTIRLDRIDELTDGKVVVIDYKTGDKTYQDWLGERPDEPQIPLYCYAHRDKLVAAAYGKLTNKGVAFDGIAGSDDIIHGLQVPENNKSITPDSWPLLLREWEHTLIGLANQISAGIATVDPKQETTCRFCDLHSFCRIKSNSAADPSGNGND